MQETSDLNERLLVKDFQEEGQPEKIDMSKIFNNEYNTSEHASEKFFKEHLKLILNGEKESGETTISLPKKRTRY